jgi:hypothetical protein
MFEAAHLGSMDSLGPEGPNRNRVQTLPKWHPRLPRIQDNSPVETSPGVGLQFPQALEII